MRTAKLTLAVSAALAAAVLIPTVAFGGHASAARSHSVILKHIRFTPSTVAISRGQSVTFRFDDGSTPHNVTSVGRLRFRSSSTKSSGSYTVRFTRAGTYSYVCTIHPGMAGKVVVH